MDHDSKRPCPDNKDFELCGHDAVCARRHGGVPTGSGGAYCGWSTPLMVEAALLDTVPMVVLLGRDMPELRELLGGCKARELHDTTGKDEAMMVTTQYSVWKRREEMKLTTLIKQIWTQCKLLKLQGIIIASQYGSRCSTLMLFQYILIVFPFIQLTTYSLEQQNSWRAIAGASGVLVSIYLLKHGKF